jgi:hypothetical protein
VNLRPPIAGHLRGISRRDIVPSAPYLGNLWRPERRDVNALDLAGGD